MPDDIALFTQWFRDAVVLLNGLRLAFLGGKWVLARGQHHIPTYPTPKALRSAILRGDVAAGDRIRIRGYVSRYAHLVKPVSYLSSCTDIASAVRLKGKIPRAIVLGNWKATQLPVSCLPPTQSHKRRLSTLFLYSTAFTGFVYRQSLIPGDNLTTMKLGGDAILCPRVAIPEQAWPVPILVDTEEPGLPVETKVEVTATLQQLPAEILRDLEPIYKSHFQVDYLGNFLRLETERILSHGLYVEPAESDVKVLKAADFTHRMIVYVEGHFENVADDPAISDAIAKLMPVHPALGAGSWSFSGQPEVEGRRMSATPDGLHVFVKPPAIVGLHGETSPAHGLTDIHKKLAAAYRGVRTSGAQALSDWSTGQQPRLALDFVYDYARQWDFDDKGIWESSRAERIVSEDPGFRDTKRWLKNE